LQQTTTIEQLGITQVEFNEALDAAIDKELAERSLKEFIKQAWKAVLEPATTFIDGWHIDAICEHLEAVYHGEIKRLLINIPPRCMKSIATSVAFPAWCWVQSTGTDFQGASTRFLAASYGADLSTRDSVKCRKVIQSPWYQRNWRDRFRFVGDQNQKTRYENDRTGYRISTSVDGLATGEGGDIIIVDDPHNVKESFSAAKREAVITWWDHTMSTRLNDPKSGAIIIIMQRVHEQDLSGHVLAEGDYDHLCLPMEFEKQNRCNTILEFSDPRQQEGELLWSDRFEELAVKRLKKSLGTYGSAGQLQQRPAPMEGGIINIDWFKCFAYPPHPKETKRVFQAWDTASKPNEVTNAPWVCITFAETKDGRIYILDVFRKWMNYPKGKRAVKNQAHKFNPTEIVIEDKSTGQSLIQELPEEKDFSFSIIAFEPDADKVTRLSVESPAIESGRVYLPEEAEWLIDFEGELASFPNSATKDQADALSMGLRHIRDKAGDWWTIMADAVSKK